MIPLSKNVQGATLSLIAFAIFSIFDISVKFLGAEYSPLQVLFMTGLMSFPIVTVYAMLERDTRPLRPTRPGWMALRVAVIIVNGVLGTHAFATLPLAQSYALFFTMPLFIVVMAVPLLGERLDLWRGGAVVAGLLGVIVALDPQGTPLQSGHVAAIAASALGATNFLIIRKTGAVERMSVMMLYPMVGQLAVVACAMPFVYVPMAGADLALTAVMAGSSFAGSLLVLAAYRLAPTVVTAPMQYFQIVWAALMGRLLFDEDFSLRMALGVAVIIAAGLVIIFRQDRPPADAPAPAGTGTGAGTA